MKDEPKTKEQLLDELNELGGSVARLREAKSKQQQETEALLENMKQLQAERNLLKDAFRAVSHPFYLNVSRNSY